MREIKFRGKKKDSSKWVYGFYVVAAGIPFISASAIRNPIPVIPETVGQFTGLFDKNGKEIYEGDIVLDFLSRGSIVKFGEYDNEESYEDNICGYGWYTQEINGSPETIEYLDGNIIIIGNIHEEVTNV